MVDKATLAERAWQANHAAVGDAKDRVVNARNEGAEAEVAYRACGVRGHAGHTADTCPLLPPLRQAFEKLTAAKADVDKAIAKFKAGVTKADLAAQRKGSK